MNNELLEKKMGVLFAQPQEKSKEKQLSPEDKKAIEKGLGDLFFGLAWTNWLNGATLGIAWQKALEQVDSFVAGKNQNNPATKYLREVAAANKARMSRIIMTSSYSNEKMNCPPEKFKEWSELGTKWTNDGLKQLNDKFKQFEPEKPQVQQFQQSKQNLILMWLSQNGRAAA